MIDGYLNYVKIIGDKFVLGLGENLNLMILYLYFFGKKNKVFEEDLKFLYDGLVVEVVVENFLEKLVDDNMDIDKDNDDSFLVQVCVMYILEEIMQKYRIL